MQSQMQKLGQKQQMMVDIVLWHSHMENPMMPWIRRQQMLILDTVLYSQFRNICFRTWYVNFLSFLRASYIM